MKFQVIVNLTKDRLDGEPNILWEGHEWSECKDKFNFWANEHRDAMDRISIRVKRNN